MYNKEDSCCYQLCFDSTVPT